MVRKRDSKATAGVTGFNACRAIVGIGASAGGIETLGRLFDAMPADSGCAFVVILHLDPTRNSQLAPVLSRHTSMPVVEITDGMSLEPNRVHVIVPDRTVAISGGKLRLTKPAEPRGQRHPVDAFFVSMAGECKHRAVGIVLSGTGSNGTHGLSEIKAQGGLALVEDPATARFAGMPRSAVAAGVADHVLAPERMPEALLRYVGHGYVVDPDGKEVTDKAPDGQFELDPVLALLRLRSNEDFRGYKLGPLQRRIHRRMGLANVATLADYTEQLRTRPEEVDALIKDLTISVTGFFRDAEAWQALDETVITSLVASRNEGAELRFWVPASATGEEAYSLAMLAVERAEAARKQFQIKIFATDRAEDTLKRARDGVYVGAAVAGVPPRRLRRFFDNIDSSYRIKKMLRDLVVFASHNVVADPPFSRLDLITCRNLLIYLAPEAQERATALFHFALREGGHLFLGNAEGLGRHDDLFDTVSKKWRIYRRLGPTRHDLVSFPVLGPRARQAPDRAGADDHNPGQRGADIMRRVLLERFAPAAVLIDRKARALYFHGPTSDYLEVPAGEPTRDVLAMVREGLRAKLRRALRQAIDANQSATFTAQGPRGGQGLVSVTVAPVFPAGSFLVTFEETPQPSGATVAPVAQQDDDAPSVHALEKELRSTREDLQSTIEQLEGLNEELKASNEEVTSINEELQSTNEELETSKEELQSFNEELQTVNSQLQYKIKELEKLSSDQNNLLAGTGVATLFLDTDQRITWFSPAIRELLDLESSDIGRPLAHFAPKFTDANLPRDVDEVLAKLTRIEAEVPGHDGHWFLRRLIPYRAQDNRITGVVLTFTDITARKQAADAVEEERLYSQAIVETISQPLLVLAGNLTVARANRAFYTLFRVSPEETENRLVYELGNRHWNIPGLRKLLEELLIEDQHITDFEVQNEFDRIGPRTMRLNARRLARGGGRPDLILLAIDDITERARTEAHRDLLVRELSHRVRNTLATVQAIAQKSLQQCATLETFRPAFEGRLGALARSHELLSNENWSGAEIGQLVSQALDAHALNHDGRIAAEGPRIVLPPQPGVALLLILHELTTNATKYGALSRTEGKLAVTWLLEDGDGGPRIRLRWAEAGGPPVAPPSRRGFGTTLIERGAPYELGGSAKLDFRESGLCCELSFPVPPAEKIE